MAKPLRLTNLSQDADVNITHDALQVWDKSGSLPLAEIHQVSTTFLMTLDPSAAFRLLRFELAVVDPGITASEVLNIGVDAGDGADYDHIIHTEDFTGVSSVVSVVVPFGDNFTYEADDQITVSCPNSIGLSMAARLVYELL